MPSEALIVELARHVLVEVGDGERAPVVEEVDQLGEGGGDIADMVEHEGADDDIKALSQGGAQLALDGVDIRQTGLFDRSGSRCWQPEAPTSSCSLGQPRSRPSWAEVDHDQSVKDVAHLRC